MGPLARAFLRHAVGAYYAAATKTDKEQVTFIWQRVFLTALTKYRAAVLRHCQSIRLLYVRRKYTDLTDTIADIDRAAFAPVADIGTQGDFSLAPGLTRAIELAEKDLAIRLDNISKPPPKRPRHNPPTPP